MDSDIDISASLSALKEELSSSYLLNVDFNQEGSLEIIPASINDFFDSFELGKEFEFTSFFDSSFTSDDGKVEFNKQRILRKNRYSKSDLTDKLDTRLLMPNKVTSCLLPLGQDRSLAFLEKQKDVYLTFGNYFYQQKNQKSISVAPLVFFKVIIRRWENTFYLSLDYNSPLYNLPLLSYLKENYKLDLEIEQTSFDPSSLIKKVNDKSSLLSFAADTSINLLNISVIRDLRLANVVDYGIKMVTDPIFKELVNPKHANVKGEYKIAHPQYIKDNLDELSALGISAITSSDKTSDEFIKSAIDETILNKSNVLLVCSTPAEKKKMIKRLESEYYDAFMCYGDISKPGKALFTYIESASNKPGYLVDSSILLKKENVKTLKDTLKSLDKKLQKNDFPVDENSREFYKHYEEYKAKAKVTFKFNDNDDYTYENYLADLDFVTFVNSNPDFRDESFTVHPYYGLSSNVKKDQYDDIIRFMSNMVDDIDKFNAAISKSEIKSSGWSDFNSLKDYDDSNKLFSIFSKYEGFPEEYFKIDFTPEFLDDVDNLISCFRLEASVRLSIDVLCRPEIWQMDFDQILEAVDDRKKEKQLMKQMKTIIKILPLKKNFKTLVVLVDKFQDNRHKIEETLPRVTKVFGQQGSSLDGLLSIKSAYDFISAYRRHQKIYDDLNFDNPFTNKIFHDKDFSYKYKTEYYPSISQMRSVIELDFDKYRKIFDEDKDDYFSISFKEIKDVLKNRIQAPKDKFINYLAFSLKADAGSSLLRDALFTQEKAGLPLVNFENDYFASVYQWLMLKNVKVNASDELIKKHSESLFSLYRLFNSVNDLDRIDVIKSFSLLKTTYVSKPSYQQTIKTLKALYHLKRMFSIAEALKNGKDIFFHVYPLTVACLDELTTLYNYKFDLTIVDMSSNSSTLDLLSVLMCSKKALIIDNNHFKSLPRLDFSYEKDMKMMNIINAYPYSLKESLQNTYLYQGIKLIQDKVVDQHLTVPFYFEKGEEKFALRMADGSDKCEYDPLFALEDNLLKCYQIKLVSLYPMSYLVYKSLMVMSTYRDVNYIIESMKKEPVFQGKLTYDQQRREEYFATLDNVSRSFKDFTKIENVEPTLDNSPLLRSKKGERLIINISYYEIANGILSYLSRFTYLTEDTLLSQISRVVGTDEMDVDFRLLFTRAEKYLLDNKIILKDGTKLSLTR